MKVARKPKPALQKMPLADSKTDKVRFWTLLVLLAMSVTLAWLINSGLSQTLTDQFTR